MTATCEYLTWPHLSKSSSFITLRIMYFFTRTCRCNLMLLLITFLIQFHRSNIELSWRKTHVWLLIRMISPRKKNILWALEFKYIENFTTRNWKFSGKNLIFFIFLLKTDCGYTLEPPRRGRVRVRVRVSGSNDYPQSMFLSRNKKILYTPVNPSFTI